MKKCCLLFQILQQAEVPLVSRDTCQEAYNSQERQERWEAYEITESMRCAGYAKGGIDACEADSGGPLVCPRGGTWFLMGITSWGDGCAREDSYGVYADVLVVKSWVEETINQG